MANVAPQNLSNHVRWDPLFHFFLGPVFIFTAIATLIQLIRRPSFHMAWLFVVTIALVGLAFKTRLYALKVQTRLIRLEERLRLSTLLSEPLRSRIGELTEAQLVGLRFASDAEIPTLVSATLTNNWSTSEIKKQITNWRADQFRV